VAMMFCQLARAHSLREICQGLAACEGKLKHLGLPDAPKKSTLAYANEHRPWEVYQDQFCALLARVPSGGISVGLRQPQSRRNNSGLNSPGVALYPRLRYPTRTRCRSISSPLLGC
jgi:hypothetical protein